MIPLHAFCNNDDDLVVVFTNLTHLDQFMGSIFGPVKPGKLLCPSRHKGNAIYFERCEYA